MNEYTVHLPAEKYDEGDNFDDEDKALLVFEYGEEAEY